MIKEIEKIPFYRIAELKASAHQEREFELYRLEKFVEDIDHLKRAHRHDHFALYFITDGNGLHSLDFSEYKLKRGRIFFSYAGQVHAWLGDQAAKGFVILFNADYFNRNDQNKRLRDFIFFNALQMHPYLDLDSGGLNRFRQIFIDIEQEHGRHDHYPVIIQAYLTILLNELLRLYGASLNPEDVNRGIIEKVQEFENRLDQDYRTQKSVNVYAEVLNITPNYLNTICKKVKGKAASELIHNRVILEAKRYLTHSSDSVSEISYQLGFEDNSYFGRFFKKRCGVTPAGFRRRLTTL